MSYAKWNKALLDYFFKIENGDEEISLFIDGETLSKIGTERDLGNEENFVDSLLISDEDRLQLITSPKQPKDIKKIKRGLFGLSEFFSEKIYDQELRVTNEKLECPYLAILVFLIYARTKSETDNGERGYYSAVKSIYDKKGVTDKDINKCLKLSQKLWKALEKWSESNEPKKGIFRPRLAGKLKFVGIINYQLVLNPKERESFEKTLFQFSLQFDPLTTTFPEFANKFLSVLPIGNYKLRNKLIKAESDPMMAGWFLNRAIRFDHDKFANINQHIKKEKQTGDLVFYFNKDDYDSLHISAKANTEEDLIDEENGRKVLMSSTDSFGYSLKPVEFKKKITLEETQFEIEGIRFSTGPVADVSFFQLGQEQKYRITNDPVLIDPCFVVVRNNSKIIANWEKWCTENDMDPGEHFTNEKLFGNQFVIYNIKCLLQPYNPKSENDKPIIRENYKDNIVVKWVGGYRLRGTESYLDVSLPSLKLMNPELTFQEIEVTPLMHGKKDEDITLTPKDNLLDIHLGEDKTINDQERLTIKLQWNKTENEKSFSILRSDLYTVPEENLVKFDTWGLPIEDNETSLNKFYNGFTLKGADNKPIATSYLQIDNVVNEANDLHNSFIYLLSALTHKKQWSQNKAIGSKDISDLIAATEEIFRANDKTLKPANDYTRTNLIRNLIAMGYLNKRTLDGKFEYQVIPPSIIRISNTITQHPNQCFKLTGGITRRMMQAITQFCDENGVTIKYKHYTDELISYDKAFMPNLVFISQPLNTKKLNSHLEDSELPALHIENKHSVGDSLLNFISNVSDYETAHLSIDPKNYSNTEFEQDDQELGLPRIIWKEHEKYLRDSKGVFSQREIPINWARLYTEHKRGNKVIFLGRQKHSTELLAKSFYMQTRFRLPSILFKALCNLNNGLPNTQKAFILNAPESLGIKQKKFILLDKYNINLSKQNKTTEIRREKIIQILTGKTTIDDNPQISFYDRKPDINKRMYYCDCNYDEKMNRDFKSLILIKKVTISAPGQPKSKQKEKISAFVDNFKNYFVVSVEANDTSIIKLNGTDYFVKKIDKGGQTTNELTTAIIEDNIGEFSLSKPCKDLYCANIVDSNKEEIKIIKLNE